MSLPRRRKIEDPTQKAGRTKITSAGWSQRTPWRGVRPEASPHWKERSRVSFRRSDVYPCNEGYPTVIRIGPIQGGLPMLFNLILADGTRCRASVSVTRKIGEFPAWERIPSREHRGGLVDYLNVAAWSSLTRRD